jgi:hypothetical protein
MVSYVRLRLITRRMHKKMSNNKGVKPKKFFGFELSDSITYVIVVVLAIIFIRQVMVLF